MPTTYKISMICNTNTDIITHSNKYRCVSMPCLDLHVDISSRIFLQQCTYLHSENPAYLNNIEVGYASFCIV